MENQKTNKQQFRELRARAKLLEDEIVGLRRGIHALAGTVSAIQPVLQRLISTQLVFERKGLVTVEEIKNEQTDKFFDEKLIKEMHDRSKGNRSVASDPGNDRSVVPGSEGVRESAQGDVTRQGSELPGVREGDGGDNKVNNISPISEGLSP